MGCDIDIDESMPTYPEFSVMTNLSCPKCFSEVEVLKKRDAYDWYTWYKYSWDIHSRRSRNIYSSLFKYYKAARNDVPGCTYQHRDIKNTGNRNLLLEDPNGVFTTCDFPFLVLYLLTIHLRIWSLQ